MTPLPPVTTRRVPGYCGAGLAPTHADALRRAFDCARRSGIRHAVTRIYPDPNDQWAELGWKYAWVRGGTEGR